VTDPSRDGPRERRELEPHPSSVAEARRAVRAALVDLGSDDTVDTAELCVSELVTNAIVHAGTRIEVRVVEYDGGVRIEVEDGSPHRPVPRNYTSLTATGRGLRMVEQLVTRWGARSHGEAKTVWFELGAPSNDPGTDDQPLGPSEESHAPAFTVELLNVPLLIHAAWQLHAESLLREYLLIHLDEDAMDELGAHAAASDAIALLEKQIQPPNIGEDPAAVMATAVEPLVSAERLLIEVPLASVPHFTVLDTLLTAAADMADAGSLLTPPIQPEIRDFRRWVCEEVRRQSEGQEPRPWNPHERYAPAVTTRPLEWDPSEVSGAHAAVIAADDAGAIVAVSSAASSALGYETPTSLVGRRLIEVIPDRFRQAHLAGVTLHLFAGRSPLLDYPITLPALCADGTELPVEVVVRSRRLARGRRLFTAELEATGT
jgi:PAS domain S-box-containing protein